MVLAILVLSVMDATSKHLVRDYPATFIVWVRYWLQTILLVALLAPSMGRRLVATQSVPLQCARGLLLATSSSLVVLSFRNLPLADATALNFASPTLLTILAVLVLGERMTAARAISVAAGMAGVLLIVRPGSDVFRGAALLPLTAALVVAIYQVLTRKLASDDARSMLFYTGLVGALGLTLLMPWQGVERWPRGWQLAELVAIGLMSSLGHFLFIRALQMAPATGLAAITYVQLVFATSIGLVAFGEFPDAHTLSGMGVIIGSGIFLTWYESRRRVLPPSEPPAQD